MLGNPYSLLTSGLVLELSPGHRTLAQCLQQSHRWVKHENNNSYPMYSSCFRTAKSTSTTFIGMCTNQFVSRGLFQRGNSPAQNPLFSQNINFFLLIKQNLLEILILDSAFAESWLCRRVFCFCRRTFSFSRIEFWFFRIKFCFLGTSS